MMMSSLLLNSPLFSQVDSFTVENRKLIASTPENWITQEVQGGLANDSTWNYLTHYVIDKQELNARIGVQIVKTTKPNEQQKRSKKNDYTISEKQYGTIKGIEVVYTPILVKSCRACGYSYLSIFVYPLSDCRTLYIAFFGNGSRKSLDSLQTKFPDFCASFLLLNETILKDFYLPKSINEKRVFTTVNILGGFPVRIENDTNWIVSADTSKNIIVLQQYYSCKKNATIIISFSQIPIISPSTIVTPSNRIKPINSRITETSPPILKTKPLIHEGSSLPREHWAELQLLDGSWLPEHDEDDDEFWEMLEVSAIQHLYHPLLPNSSVTIKLIVTVNDPIYEFYYQAVVNHLMSTVLKQNRFLREQYPDDADVTKIVGTDCDTKAIYAAPVYILFKDKNEEQTSPADKPKPNPGWRKL